MTLVFEDERQRAVASHLLVLTAFDSPPTTRSAEIGQTPILLETPGRHNHTGIGFIMRTPHRHLLKFRFTIFEGAARFEDFVFYLTELHHYCGGKVIVLWDHLPAHHATAMKIKDEKMITAFFKHANLKT